MHDTIDIAGRQAKVLAALYNASKPLGYGVLHFEPADMTEAEAQSLLDAGRTYFDYHKGRVMKINIEGDSLETYLYDRDNGPGAAARAVEGI